MAMFSVSSGRELGRLIRIPVSIIIFTGQIVVLYAAIMFGRALYVEGIVPKDSYFQTDKPYGVGFLVLDVLLFVFLLAAIMVFRVVPNPGSGN